MKKLISLVAVFAIIATSSLCAFAADIDFASATDITNQAVDGVYTVAAPSTAAYATIVAVKGQSIQVGAIQYINQASTAEGAPSFEFALNDDLLAKAETAGITDTKVYVLTGGDGEIRVAGYIETAKDDGPEMFTVSGSVVATIGKTLPVVKLTAADSTEYVATVTLNAENDQTADYTVSVPAGDYTFEITKGAHITYTSPLTVSAAKAIETITIYSGNTNPDVDTVIDGSDFAAIGRNFGTSAAIAGDAFYKAADTNDDDIVDGSEFGALGRNFGKSAAANYTNIK